MYCPFIEVYEMYDEDGVINRCRVNNRAIDAYMVVSGAMADWCPLEEVTE